MGDTQDILDNVQLKQARLFSKKLVLILLVAGIIVAITDIIYIVVNTNIDSVSAEPLTSSKTRLALLLTFVHFVLVPVCSFVAALLISIIPMKQLKYAEKYPPISILIILLFQVTLLILTLTGN